MTKAAVGTHSELLAAASPCRQTSHEIKEPVAYPWSSGQVVTLEQDRRCATAHRTLQGLWDPQSCRTSSLPGGGRELQCQSSVLSSRSQTPAAQGGRS